MRCLTSFDLTIYCNNKCILDKVIEFKFKVKSATCSININLYTLIQDLINKYPNTSPYTSPQGNYFRFWYGKPYADFAKTRQHSKQKLQAKSFKKSQISQVILPSKSYWTSYRIETRRCISNMWRFSSC